MSYKKHLLFNFRNVWVFSNYYNKWLFTKFPVVITIVPVFQSQSLCKNKAFCGHSTKKKPRFLCNFFLAIFRAYNLSSTKISRIINSILAVYFRVSEMFFPVWALSGGFHRWDSNNKYFCMIADRMRLELNCIYSLTH